MSDFELAPKALLDLEGIIGETADRRGAAAAYELEGRLIEGCERLAETPGMGHLRQDLTSRPQLFYLVQPFFIVYVRGTDPLRIVAIVHSARNLRRLLKGR